MCIGASASTRHFHSCKMEEADFSHFLPPTALLFALEDPLTRGLAIAANSYPYSVCLCSPFKLWILDQYGSFPDTNHSHLYPTRYL